MQCEKTEKSRHIRHEKTFVEKITTHQRFPKVYRREEEEKSTERVIKESRDHPRWMKRRVAKRPGLSKASFDLLGGTKKRREKRTSPN